MKILHLEREAAGHREVAAKFASTGFACEFVHASNREEYFAALSKGGFELIILDCRLPGFPDAEAVASAFRLNPNVPSVVFTDSSGQEESAACLKAGAADFIHKPDISHLLIAVRRCLESTQAKAALKRAEETLQRRELYFRSLIENAQDLISVIKGNGVMTFQSPAILRVAGYCAEELVGRCVFEFIHSEDCARTKNVVAQAMEDATRPHGLEFRFRHKDGSWRLLESVCQSFMGESAERSCVVNSRDATGLKESRESLIETEAKYRALVEQSMVGVYLIVQAKFSYFNEAGARMFGYRPDEIIGRLGPTDLTQPSDRERVTENMRQLSVEQVDFLDYEFCGLRRDGATIHCRAFDRRIVFQGQQAIIGTLLDISDEKRIQQEFSKVYKVVHLAEEVVVITDPHGHIQYVNPAFEQLTGYSKAEVLNKNPRLLKSGKHGQEFYKQLWTTIHGGGIFRETFINKKKNGELYYQQGTLFAIKDSRGNITNLASVGRDITRQRLAETELQEKAELLDHAPDAIFVCDLENRIQFWNHGAERLYGVGKSEALGKSIEEVVPSETGAKVAEIRAAVSQQGEVRRDLTKLKPDGDIVSVDSRWSAVRDEEGHIKGFLVIHRDVTEHKKLLAQYLQAQRMESIGTLASGIAHDLNNVLAPILMSVELLRQEANSEDVATILETLETCANRGVEIVRQVLSFARVHKGAHVSVQPRHLLKEVANIARETFPKNIQIKTLFPSDCWTLDADGTEIHQVFLNLCINARDAMPGGGTLTLSIDNDTYDEYYVSKKPGARSGRYVSIKVADTGTGIPEHILPRIFSPFFTTKDAGKGTGLGLSTVMGIVKSYGGWVDVETKTGHGTTFNVHFPAEIVTAMQPAQAAGMAILSGGGGLILVVDDEVAVRELVKRILENHGYRVLVAADGTEAAALAMQNMVELKAVITDLSMPMMDGITLIRVLRKINPTLKLIVMSGHGSGKDLTVAEELGIKHVLAKPFTSQKLLLALQELLKEHPVQQTGK